MKRIKQTLVTCGCLLTLLCVITVTTPRVSYGVGSGAPGPEKSFVVANTADEPVPTRDVDNPAREPFQRFLVEQLNDGEFSAGDRVSFSVPAGKRLVIEYVSLLSVVPTGQKLRVKIDAFAGGHGSHQLTLSGEGSFQGGRDDYKASHLTRIYADPGTDVFIRVARNSTSGIAGINASVSGYLVDVP